MTEDLEKIMRQLPEEFQQEVREFAKFLLQKAEGNKKEKIGLSWAGGLREFRDQYTSLTLQKKALEWWGD